MSELPGGFSRRALLGLGGVAAASFLLALAWAAFGEPWQAGPRTAGPSTFSVSALGHEGAARFLRAAGLGVTARRAPGGAGLDPRHPLIVAEPGRGAEGHERFTAAWGAAGRAGAPRLLVLPKWTGEPQPERPRWLARVRLLGEPEAAAVLGWVPAAATAAVERRARLAAPCRAAWSGADLAVEIDAAQLLAPRPDLAAEVDCPGGVLLGRLATPAGEPASFVLADPDLLNNQGLGRADHAALLHAFLAERLGATRRRLRRDDPWLPTATPGLLAEALRFPLVLAVLQALLLLGGRPLGGDGPLRQAAAGRRGARRRARRS